MTLAASRFHRKAREDLAGFSSKIQTELWDAIGELEDKGLSHDYVDFWTDNRGKRIFRLKVKRERGADLDHRIFFDIENSHAKIYGIFHRDEAYDVDVEEEVTRRLR